MGTRVRTKDMLQKLQNRALRLVLGKESRHNVWALHHEAVIPFLDKRRDCHLANFMFNRRQLPQYMNIPARQLRQYEAPVLIEYKAENSTFQRSVLFNGAKCWNQMPVEVRNIENYESFKKNRRELMLSNVR